MSDLFSDRIITTEHEGEQVLAFSCACNEEKDDTQYLVEFDEPENGVKYAVCHESCLELADD